MLLKKNAAEDANLRCKCKWVLKIGHGQQNKHLNLYFQCLLYNRLKNRKKQKKKSQKAPNLEIDEWNETVFFPAVSCLKYLFEIGEPLVVLSCFYCVSGWFTAFLGVLLLNGA